MKNQALFSLKDRSKELKCYLLQFLFGVLRVKVPENKIVEVAKCIESTASSGSTQFALYSLALEETFFFITDLIFCHFKSQKQALEAAIRTSHNSFTTKKQTTKFSSANFQKM